MKFKTLTAGLLTAVLVVNTIMAYTVIQEEKKQTRYLDILALAKIEELVETDNELSFFLRKIYAGITD